MPDTTTEAGWNLELEGLRSQPRNGGSGIGIGIITVVIANTVVEDGVSNSEGRNPNNSSTHSNLRTPPSFHLLPFPYSPLRRPDLPPQEVTSDLLFVMELVTAKPHGRQDLSPTFTHITHLIHDISHRGPLVINSASWTLLLDFFNKMLRYLIGSSSFTTVMEALQTLRRVMSTYQRKCSMAEEVLLVKFLLRIIESSHAELSSFSNSILNQSSVLEVGKRILVPRCGSLWEIQTLAFTMVGEAISRVGSSFPLDIWRSTIEVAILYF